LADYVAWGKREGGKGGAPWAKRWGDHVERRTKEVLAAIRVNRLEAITLEAFEKAVSKWSAHSRGNVGGSFKAFMAWAKKRKIVAYNPLEDWTAPKPAPRDPRRSLALNEIVSLLAAMPYEQSLAYEFVLATGARSNELNLSTKQNLIRRDGRGYYVMPAGITKSKRAEEIPLNDDLWFRLADYCKTRLPAAPLFDLSRQHKSRAIKRHLKVAGIPYRTAEGKVDFHALRTSYVNLVNEHAPDITTAMELNRHKDVRLTAKTYGRTSISRKSETADRIAITQKDQSYRPKITG
jgi:integrase